jgi:hypothetical protein
VIFRKCWDESEIPAEYRNILVGTHAPGSHFAWPPLPKSFWDGRLGMMVIEFG